MNIPASVTDIDAQWLTTALQRGGHLNGQVVDFEVEPVGVGVGLMSQLARFRITYEGDQHPPANLMVKCAAQTDNRAVAQLLDFYNREANFYTRMSAQCPLRTAQCYYVDVNQANYDFVLILENLSALATRDQLVGASRDEIMVAVGKVAQMHAQYWGKTADQTWMYDVMGAEEAVKLKTYVYMPSLEPALNRFDYCFTEAQRALVRTVGENYSDYWATNGCPNTFIHGDYRQDNMMYPSGAAEAIVIDWQICGYGKGIFDIAYLMCQSVDPDLRGKIEMDVLAHYRDALQEQGVTYGEQACLKDYCLYVLGCLIYPITVCGTLDLSNERGRALGESMLTRNLRAVVELDCMGRLS